MGKTKAYYLLKDVVSHIGNNNGKTLNTRYFRNNSQYKSCFSPFLLTFAELKPLLIRFIHNFLI